MKVLNCKLSDLWRSRSLLDSSMNLDYIISNASSSELALATTCLCYNLPASLSVLNKCTGYRVLRAA